MNELSFKQISILLIVLLIALSSMLGIDIHLASLPYIETALHTDKAHMQQSISSFILGMGVSLLIYGPLSDKFGRKPIVIVGLLIASITSFGSIFSSDIDSFLAWRFFQGVGLGVGTGIGRTIFADILIGESLAVVGSYFSTLMSLSPLFAPVAGGYLQHYFGWKSNFILLGCFSFLLTIAFAFCCPETNKHKNSELKVNSMLKNYSTLLGHPIFVNSTILTGLAMCAMMTYVTTSPYIFQKEFHLEPIMYGWITMVAGCGGFVGKFLGPFIIKKIGSVKAIKLGIFGMVFAGFLISVLFLLKIETIISLVIAIFIAYISFGFML